MNLFLPEETISESVKALDDRRLIKQILECKTILDVANKTKNGYARHPVVTYYKDYPYFIAEYGYMACLEYWYRTKKNHKYNHYFLYKSLMSCVVYPQPFYCEGSKTDPNCIRTTENTVELFRKKLCKKWNNDKYSPKWTNRQPPEWYKNKGDQQ